MRGLSKHQSVTHKNMQTLFILDLNVITSLSQVSVNRYLFQRCWWYDDDQMTMANDVDTCMSRRTHQGFLTREPPALHLNSKRFSGDFKVLHVKPEGSEKFARHS